MASIEMINIPVSEYEGLKSEITLLKYQLAELKRLIFGAKSERFLALFPAS